MQFFLEKAPPPLALLPLHFDVERHLLSSDIFVKSIQTAELMTKSINEIFFEGKLEARFYFLPSQRGGFIELIALSASLSALVLFHQSDTFQGFYKGLTGRDYNAYEASERLGEVIRDLLAGLLISTTKKIRELIGDDERLNKLLKYKTELIEKFQENNAVKGFGIGFKNDFPVKREKFNDHKCKRPMKRKPDKVLHLYGAVLKPVMIPKQKATWEILYTSSNYKSSKRSKIFNGFMKDEDFSSNFHYGDTRRKWPPEGIKIEVEALITQLSENGEIKSKLLHKIIKVISFDGKRLVPKNYIIGSASERYIEECLGRRPNLVIYNTDNQPTLFDDD